MITMQKYYEKNVGTRIRCYNGKLLCYRDNDLDARVHHTRVCVWIILLYRVIFLNIKSSPSDYLRRYCVKLFLLSSSRYVESFNDHWQFFSKFRMYLYYAINTLYQLMIFKYILTCSRLGLPSFSCPLVELK